MEYSEEPRLVFSPLSDNDYSLFYSLEMASFTEDASYYSSFLKKTDTVLELGCGNGRLTRSLAGNCLKITGIDISPKMIDLARKKTKSNINYRCMDMIKFNFPYLFDTIIIPYNTLNLLGEKSKIEKCLKLCKKHLNKNAKLLLHLYHPDNKILKSQGERLFQFCILEQGNNAKIIKETLKSYCSSSKVITLEERYRVRPMQSGKPNRDLKHFLKLYTPLLPCWHELLQASGFAIENHWGSYNFSPFCDSTDTILLVHAAPT